MGADFDVAALLTWRARRDDFLRDSYMSPIPEEERAEFAGLSYFEPNPEMSVRGRFFEAEGTVDIASSTGSTTAYRLAGHVAVELGGRPLRLAVLHGEVDDLFVPFRDGTSGAESYGGGRYAPAEVSGSAEATIDFNRAVNPYCAYDEEFSCPLPPAENWLPIRVEAGEKSYAVARPG